jgi:hypothetical protein
MRANRTRRRTTAQPSLLATLGKPTLALLVATSLLAAVAGGLLRAGVPGLGESVVIGQAAVAHAALMLSGFLGTAIGVERAVAIKLRWAFAAPLLSGLASVFFLAGDTSLASGLAIAAALVFVAVNTVVVKRQRADHTALLLMGALAWLVGNALFAEGLGAAAVLPWWFAFPVLTIAAERLEMTRLMRRHPAAHGSLYATLAALLLGAALCAASPTWGGVVFGAALTALAVWFGVFDIARRTALAHGLARYMAMCLLVGYVWLGIAGVAWIGMALGCPGRDLALHALGLGFIVSMVMGHAPVILPAVARVKLHFGPWFYAAPLLLHASLVLRLFGGIGQPQLRTAGAALNAAAMALFALTLLGSALAWRARERTALQHEAL